MSMKWLLGIEALSLRVFAREQPIIREAGTLLDGKGGVQIFASESSRDGGGTRRRMHIRRARYPGYFRSVEALSRKGNVLNVFVMKGGKVFLFVTLR